MWIPAINSIIGHKSLKYSEKLRIGQNAYEDYYCWLRKVGTSLAERLSVEDHDLVMVDLSEQKVEEVSNRYDAMGIVGNGASFNVQQEAGVDTADLFIAVTGEDELNLLCCLIAKKNAKCHTIARVRNPLYNKEIRFIREQLGISMIINPELTAAREILKVLKFPSAIKIDTFAKGRVELLHFRVKPEMGFDGKTIMELMGRLKTDVLICAVERDSEVVIPNGSFVLHDNDILSIAGSLEQTAEFFEKIGVRSKKGAQFPDHRRRDYCPLPGPGPVKDRIPRADHRAAEGTLRVSERDASGS